MRCFRDVKRFSFFGAFLGEVAMDGIRGSGCSVQDVSRVGICLLYTSDAADE